MVQRHPSLSRVTLLFAKDPEKIYGEPQQNQRHQGEHQLVQQEAIKLAGSGAQKSRTGPVDELGEAGDQERELQPRDREGFLNGPSDA